MGKLYNVEKRSPRARSVGKTNFIDQGQRMSEERLKSIFKAAPVGIGVVINRVINEANEVLCTMTGYAREELIGQSARMLYPSEHDFGFVGREKYRQIAEDGIGSVETRWQRKDGAIIDILLSSAPLDPRDLSLGVTFSALDITQRKQMEKDIRTSNERLWIAQKAANAGLWDWDLLTGKLFWSEELFSLFGLSPKAAASFETWLKIVHPEDRESAMAKIQKAIDERIPLENEYRIITCNGVERWIAALGNTYYSDAGKPERMIGICIEITERKQAEEALRKSEEWLRLALEGGKLAAWNCHMGTNEITWNEEHFRMFCYDPHTVVPSYTAWRDRVHPEDRPTIEAQLRRDIKLGGVYTVDYRILWPDGTVRWVESRCRHEHDAKGRPIRSYGVITDITARKQLEEELRQSRDELEHRVQERTQTLKKANDQLINEIEQRKRTESALKQAEQKYRDIFENAMEGIFQSTHDGRLLRVNPAFARIFGYESPDEIITAVTDIARELYVSPEDRRSWIRAVEEQGYIENYERQLYRKDGKKVWLSFNVHAVRDHQGFTHYYEGSVRDITNVKNAEEERRRLIAAIDKAAEAIYVIDRDGVVDYANAAYCTMTGYTRDELIGKKIAITHHEDMEQSVFDDLRLAIHNGKAWIGTLRKKRKDGTYFEERITVAPLKDDREATTHYVCVGIDVTDHIAVQEQLRQAQKMEAIGTLAGGIAHDFNNMLAIIMGNAELALDDLQQPEPRRNLEAILGASKRSRDLVKQILTFSRKSGAEEKAVDMVRLLEETQKLLRPSLPATIRIDLDIHAEPGTTVMGDASKIQQVILNLSSNAAHAMREKGGTLTMGLATVSLGTDPLQDAAGSGPYVKLTVKDTGIGIPLEIRRRMFDPFFTTKEPGQGTGMGLAVVYGIVKDLNGMIEVESEVGKGAIFTVLFPQAHIAAPDQPQHEAAEPSGKEHILLVDDEAGFVDMTRMTLERLGYRVTAETDSLAAVKAFTASPQSFDLIVTDQTMPDMTGIQLARMVRDIRKDVPVILCTGYSETVSAETAKQAGVGEFLMKPIRKKQMAQSIRRVLDKGKTTQPPIKRTKVQS